MKIERVYLAGGINGLNDADATDWREEAKRLIRRDVAVIDPMSRDYRGKEDDNVKAIVEGDKADIASCHAIIAMCARPSWGTGMEIEWNHDNREIKVYDPPGGLDDYGKPITNGSWSAAGHRLCVAIVPGDTPVSPWLRYHTDAVVHTLEDAIERLGLSIVSPKADTTKDAYARGKMPRAAYHAKPADEACGPRRSARDGGYSWNGSWIEVQP